MKPLFLALVLAASSAFASDFKAAFVDLRRAVAEVEDGKAARARMQTFVDAKQKDIDKERTVLLKDQELLEKQGPQMAEAERKKKEDDLQNKVMAMARRADLARGEIADQERRELAVIAQRMDPLLGKLAEKEGFTMVFDKSGSGLAWAPPALDMTNQLIRFYNESYKGKPLPPPEAPKAQGPAPKGEAPRADAPVAPKK
jgi:outer membrane protein